MKRIFTTAMLALLGAGAFAQTSQGTIAASGSVTLGNSSSKYDNSSTNSENISRSFCFSPSIGYFVQEGLELGVGTGFYQGINRYKHESEESKSRSQSINFSPYARKYIALTEQLQLHGTGYVTAGFGNNKSQDYQESSYKETSTSSRYGIGFYPGLTYFATPKLGLTATFGTFSYSRSKTTPKNDPHETKPYTSNSFTADLSPNNIGIGFSYFIAR
jgi:hypothetical protein